MYCQATSGASESRHGAPKSRLSASARAASATTGGWTATTWRSSEVPNGSGPRTATASTENSRSAMTQSLRSPSRLTLSKLTGSCIDVFGKNRDNSTLLLPLRIITRAACKRPRRTKRHDGLHARAVGVAPDVSLAERGGAHRPAGAGAPPVAAAHEGAGPVHPVRQPAVLVRLGRLDSAAIREPAPAPVHGIDRAAPDQRPHQQPPEQPAVGPGLHRRGLVRTAVSFQLDVPVQRRQPC